MIFLAKLTVSHAVYLVTWNFGLINNKLVNICKYTIKYAQKWFKSFTKVLSIKNQHMTNMDTVSKCFFYF